MADQRLHRAHPVDLELRGGDGRTLTGLAVPFDAPTQIREAGRRYTEVFRRGAFARSIRERGDRIKLLANHDRRRLPIGRAELLREDAAGLYGEFRVSQTDAGDEVLALVRDGALDGLSISFEPLRDHWSTDRSEVERLEAKLVEVSAVAFPAYDGAVITGVRADSRSLPVEDAERRLGLITRSLR